MQNVFREIEDVLLPRPCPVCGKILPVSEGGRVWIHRDCCKKLTLIREPVCKKCGKPLSDAARERCSDCSANVRDYEYGRSIWRYDRFSGQLIFSYKYDRQQELARDLGRIACRCLGGWMKSRHADALVPVPVSRPRMVSRGFNQALLLAEEIGSRLDIPVKEALRRSRKTAPQKELGKKQRLKNLAGAFKARPEMLTDVRRVLLIDDIYTTGSTIELCTKALKEAGVEQIWFFTLCIGGKD
jgi:ComF family protein